jgi:hypothetical protein
MDVYINESGSFLVPEGAGRNLSCVDALVVREGFRETLVSRYASLARSWDSSGREIKGSGLNESQVAADNRLLNDFPGTLRMKLSWYLIIRPFQNPRK